MSVLGIIEGRVHRLGDNIDTDVILPGRYLTLRDPDALGRHCLEGVDPGLAARLQSGAVLAVGRNFGSGSSREHAVVALKAAGVRAVVAVSFARIFFRNAVNLGLPVVICAEAAASLEEGADATVDIAGGRIQQGGRAWAIDPLGQEVTAILAAGGLVPRIRRTLRAEPAR